MGKGDKKTKKGKIWRGSFGNSRLKKKIKERLKRISSKKPVVSVEAVETVEVAKPKAKRTVKKKEGAAE